jgi:zinc transport system ATP-binding protein
LKEVDLAVDSGEFVAIAGPNGGGKTTLLRIALGLERPTRGDALLFGEPANRFSRRARIGYLAQRAQLGIDAPVTVREIVATGRVPRRGLFGPLSAADRAIVEESIARVGLSAQSNSVLARLSGGQQQRAFIAKALAARPDLLVLDEPTAGVDVGAKAEIHRKIQQLASEGLAVVVVSSDLPEVLTLADRILVMREGSLQGELPGAEATEEAVMHLATTAHATEQATG